MPESGQWAEHLLGNVAEVVGGGTPSTGKASYWGGSIPWITPGEVTRQEGRVVVETERAITDEGLAACSAKLLPENAVLVTSRATVGAVALAGRPMATNQGFAALVAREGVLPRFLMYWVQANRAEFQSRASGSTFPEISRTKVKAIPILLPPLGIQRRIVDLIGALDGLIAAITHEHVATFRAREAVRGALMRPRPDWFETTLGVAAEIFDGPHATPVKTAEGPWYLSISSLRQGEVDLEYSAHLSEQDLVTWTRRVAPRRGDTLFSYETRLGEAGHWESDVDAALGRRMGVLRPRSDRLLPQFLTHLYLAPAFQALIEDRAVRGSTVDRIPIALIGGWPISFPGVDEQRRILATLTAMDQVVRALRDEIFILRMVRTVLLRDLLIGEVTIPESYDALLAEAV